VPAASHVARIGSPGLVSRIVSRRVSSPRVVVAVGAVVGAFALAGCGAGQITQTGSQQSGVGGASANVGQIAVREAAFAFAGDGKTAAIYRAGGDAPLTMTVVNFGSQVDKLTNASSPAAESVRITGDGTIASGRALLVQGQPAGEPAGAPGASAQATPGARPSAGASATPAPGASEQATPAPSASAQAAPAPGPTEQASPAPDAGAAPGARPAPATAGPEAAATAAAGAAPPPSGQVTPGTTTAQVVLTGLKEDLKVGPTYPVVLTFQRAGDVTIQVPVANPSENQGPSGE
jgi:copper(I)-binding protein